MLSEKDILIGIATPIDSVWNHLVTSIIWYNSIK